MSGILKTTAMIGIAMMPVETSFSVHSVSPNFMECIAVKEVSMSDTSDAGIRAKRECDKMTPDSGYVPIETYTM